MCTGGAMGILRSFPDIGMVVAVVFRSRGNRLSTEKKHSTKLRTYLCDNYTRAVFEWKVTMKLESVPRYGAQKAWDPPHPIRKL